MSRKVKPPIPDTYTILTRAVEEGVRWGIKRYNKYATDPIKNTDVLAIDLEQAIMNAICDVFVFPDLYSS